MKITTILAIFIFVPSLFAQERNSKIWGINVYSTAFSAPKINSTKGDWTVRPNPNLLVWNVEIVRHFSIVSKLNGVIGLGLGFLPGDVEFLPPLSFGTPQGMYFADPNLIGTHFYIPLKVEYQALQYRKFSFKPYLGGRASFILSGFYDNSFGIDSGVFGNQEASGGLDAIINQENEPVFLTAEAGLNTYWNLNTANALLFSFGYSHSNKTVYKGSYIVREGVQAVAAGSYDREFNFWAIGIGYTREF